MMMTMMMGPKGPGTLGPRAKRAQGPMMMIMMMIGTLGPLAKRAQGPMMMMLMVMMFDADDEGDADNDDV